MKEIWKDIEDYEGYYQISNFGRVRNRYKKLIKANISSVGYPWVCLQKDYSRKWKTIHRLISLHFIPNPDNLPQVNHKNGIKTDNRVENLEWCTVSYNSHHAYDTGLKMSSKGESHGMVKLSENNVKEIRKLLNNGLSCIKIAKIFEVTRQTIGNIKRGSNWGHLKE